MRSKRDYLTVEELEEKLLMQREYLDRLYNGEREDTPAVRQLVIAHNEGRERMLAELVRELRYND